MYVEFSGFGSIHKRVVWYFEKGKYADHFLYGTIIKSVKMALLPVI